MTKSGAVIKIDGFVKSSQSLFSVIPVETGIQSFQCLANTLDSRLRGNDDFLRNDQDWATCILNVNKLITLNIEKIAYGGAGLGHAEGKVVFVPFTAPGDRAIVEVTKEKKDYLEAVLKSLEKTSPLRTQPFCPVFGRCGGCQLQHIDYPEQMRLKGETLKESLRRFFEEEQVEFLAMIPSPRNRAYRLRAQFKTAASQGKTVLGFYGLRSHQVVGIRECPLFHPLGNRIFQGVQKEFDKRGESLALVGVDVLVSPDEGKGVIRLEGQDSGTRGLAEELEKGIQEVKGVISQGRKRASRGDPTLWFRLPVSGSSSPLQIQVSPDSFFQVNLEQNLNLILRVLEWADLSGKENVLDLFCGAGNLALPLAQKAGRVWGVDIDREAVAKANLNARVNFLKNCEFLASSAEAGIRKFLQEKETLDLAVLDPPRAGAKEILEPLARLKPAKILYVSCEPPTLARDLVCLRELGYNVTRVQPLDMFPQTYHLEVIAELVRSGDRGDQ